MNLVFEIKKEKEDICEEVGLQKLVFWGLSNGIKGEELKEFQGYQ